MDLAEITLQAITLPFLHLLRWIFFDDFLIKEDLIFLKSKFYEANGENWCPFLSLQKTLVLSFLS